MSNNWIGKISLLLVLVLTGAVIYNWSNKSKLAFINTKLVFEEFKLKKELSKKFENETAYTKRFLDSVGFKLQTRAKYLELNKNAKQEEIAVFLDEKETYLARLEMFSKEKNQLSSKYDEQILKQMNQYILDFGKENDYTYIFGSEGTGNIMYAKESEDISKQIIEYINKKYDGK